MKYLMMASCLLLCTACSKQEDTTAEKTTVASMTPVPTVAKIDEEQANIRRLEQILAQQDEATKERYVYRHPLKTLQFFGLKPGMTVVEVLPGGGWYSNILIPYIGAKGKLIGVDYPVTMWPNFDWAKEEFITKRKAWPTTWPSEMQAKFAEEGAAVEAYTFDTLPQELSESADLVLFVRALHNLARFENDGKFLSEAVKETYRVLKHGGYVGVVQHQAPEDKSAEWADGSKGYLKKSWIIEVFKEHGFQLVKESSINENPKDMPAADDSVWRLPPSLGTSKEDEALKAKMQEIGESNRMTLLFMKP
ncbi:hypothetical protein TDB9533_03356 [Thalassocella blandensis]|nr:hypothetical protein TDB9533_03356 [Thalassocella blandensis]